MFQCLLFEFEKFLKKKEFLSFYFFILFFYIIKNLSICKDIFEKNYQF